MNSQLLSAAETALEWTLASQVLNLKFDICGSAEVLAAAKGSKDERAAILASKVAVFGRFRQRPKLRNCCPAIHCTTSARCVRTTLCTKRATTLVSICGRWCRGAGYIGQT